MCYWDDFCEGVQFTTIHMMESMLGETMTSMEVGGIDVSKSAPLEGSSDASVTIV